MSTVLHRRQINVAITAREAGKEFANASADVQVEFLAGMVEAVREWKDLPGTHVWPMQCRFIVDEMDATARAEAASLIDTLLDHLREPVSTGATP